MKENPVLRIIEQAFGDNALRQQLQSDMSGTLKKMGQELSPDQSRELSKALDESGETFAAGLDQRLSQSGVSLNPQALLQQSKKKAGQSKNAADISALPIGLEAEKKSRDSAASVEGKKTEAGSEDDFQYDSDEPDFEVERD